MSATNGTPWLHQLPSLSYEDLFEELAAINQETQFLEFKQELDPVSVAKEAVAMANANGGTIVIGINDPVENKSLSAAETTSFGTDEPACRKLRSQILSRCYPSVSVDVYGFRSNADRAMLVVRVNESKVAPHEFTAERGRFLVRRGTQIDGLSLREIENQLRRRDALGAIGHGFEKSFKRLSFERTASDEFLGIHLSPQHVTSKVMIQRDELKIVEKISTIDGLKNLVHETQADGVLFREKPSGSQNQLVEERLRKLCYVRSDGAIEIRLPLDSNTSFYQLCRILGHGFALSSWVLNFLGQGPLVRGAFVYCYNNAIPSTRSLDLDGNGEILLNIDLSRDSFEQAFTEPILYALRASGKAENPEEIEDLLISFWRNNYGYRSDLSNQDW